MSVRIALLVEFCIRKSPDAIMMKWHGSFAQKKEPKLDEWIRARLPDFQHRVPQTRSDAETRQKDADEESKLTGTALELAINQRKQKEGWATSETAMGKIWTKDTYTAIKGFATTCCMIMSKCDLDDLVVRTLQDTNRPAVFGLRGADIKPDNHVRRHEWRAAFPRYKRSLRAAMKRDSVYVADKQDDNFRRILLDVVYESLLPLGSRMEHYMSDATRHSEEPQPMQVFQEQCGSMAQTFIHWIINKDNPAKVLDHVNGHPMYDLFCVALLSYIFLQLVEVDFLALYFKQASQVYNCLYTHVLRTKTLSGRVCRPVITCLKRKWVVIDKGQIVDTTGLEDTDTNSDGLFDSLVVWLAVMKHEFGGKT